MKLQEILDHLSAGELSAISIGKQDQGVINDTNREQVVSNINLALTAIHKRFNLREGRMTVHLNEDASIYKLDKSRVGGSNSNRGKRYLEEDKLFELKDGLLKVERVYTDRGRELSLNNLSDPFSLRTPRYDLLEVPEVMVRKWPNCPEYLKTETLLVYYRANHPKLGKYRGDAWMDATCCDACEMEEIEVDLPEPYLPALLFWVGSRFHNPIGMSNEFHMGNSYFAKYENECQRLEAENLQVDRASTPGFRQPGWA